MSIAIKTEKEIVQPSKPFNSLLNSMQQQRSLTNNKGIFDRA